MLFQNSIINTDNSIIFMNDFSFNEAFDLMCKIIENMAEDLSSITGIPKEEIIQDYKELNEYHPLRELLRKRGQWQEELDKSLVMTVMEKRLKEKRKEQK